ncbi:ESF1 like protein [Elysia marginata]|uniref:ESF1 like protein n=1 Tax=Elysia marginata TaxID=1093978 RepID=A0AAV4HX61_9GAST|nr:ESF1 like protein [Elysia marginata]
MESIKKDERFSHISSDPRFRPMPKSKKRVKIDNRFQSIFTNKDFTHETIIDKRGRPRLNGSKKQKHVMERFYDLSDSESGDGEDLPSALGETNVKKKKSDQTGQKLKAKKRKFSEEKKSSSTNKKAKLTKSSMEAGDDEAEAPDDSSSEDEQDASRKELPGTKTLPDDEDGSDAPSSDNNDDDDNDSGGKEEDFDSDVAEYTQEHELEETEVDHKWNELHTEAPEVTESTKRLAVCNMDWDFVKAQDLFVLFKSFAPEGGAVRCVTIYPSEFGKERMTEEALLGPKEMRKQQAEEGEQKIQDGGKGRKKKNSGIDQQKAKNIEKHKEDAQTEKLREYQLNRLRYYYAVVECDSVRTADNIYTECDGREYQLSSVRLDLRFIPEDMIFDDEPKDQFTDEQGLIDYQPSQFNSSALSQAKVEVTWDETEFDRLSRRMSALQQKELQTIVEENKYADIIAPPESDSDDERDGRPDWLKNLLAEDGDEGKDKVVSEEEKIKLYRQVLMEKVAEDEEEEKKEEGEFDKEMAWQPGLKSAAEKKIKRQEKKKEQNAIVGDYLEKKKEKKKKKKEEKLKKRKEGSMEEEEGDNDLAFSDDDLPAGFDIEDMKEMLDGDERDLLQSSNHLKSANAQKKKNKGNNVADDDNFSDSEKKAKAELELMLMDSDAQHLKKPAKPEIIKDSDGKRKKKKNKLAKLKKTEEDKEDFVLDVEDPRFSALYSSHHFHIDPTAPQFKKTKNMLKLVDEQIKRKSKKDKKGKVGNTNSCANNTDQQANSDNTHMSNSKSKSQSLLESLKRKMNK